MSTVFTWHERGDSVRLDTTPGSRALILSLDGDGGRATAELSPDAVVTLCSTLAELLGHDHEAHDTLARLAAAEEEIDDLKTERAALRAELKAAKAGRR